ncbi:MAG: 30S ribosomal protein S17 [Nitrospirota bacterium]
MSDKIYTGKVVSDRMDKTIVVAVTRLFQHPVYKKTVKKVSKFKAHDEKNECKIGDKVKIIETKPLSKDKRWQVLEILDKSVRSSEK